MKKIAAIIAAAGIVGFGLTGTALAKKPENPGCFGQDRAAILHALFIGNKDGELADGTELEAVGDGNPGASGWGAIASERGSSNGEQNRAYRSACGGDPDPS
jgi:hypothetical protein